MQYYLGQAIKEEMEDSEGKKWYQEVHYQTGIGSDWAECGYYLLNYFTAMTGKGISLRIKAAYVWFCNRYREGDEIYLSGYSRGAFIARTVGGWIGRHGLYQKGGLTKDDPEIDQLYQLYLKSMEPGVTSVSLSQTCRTWSLTP